MFDWNLTRMDKLLNLPEKRRRIFYGVDGQALRTRQQREEYGAKRGEKLFKPMITVNNEIKLMKSNEGYKSRYIHRLLDEYEEHYAKTKSKYGLTRHIQSAPLDKIRATKQHGVDLLVTLFNRLNQMDDDDDEINPANHEDVRTDGEVGLMISSPNEPALPRRKMSDVIPPQITTARRSSIQVNIHGEHRPGSRRGSVVHGVGTARSMELWALLARQRRSSVEQSRRRSRRSRTRYNNDDTEFEDVNEQNETSEKVVTKRRPSKSPLVRFRRAAKLIHIILVAISSTRRENKRQEAKLMSFSQLQDEINQRTVYGDDLEFDPAHFKACKELQISHEAKTIMSMDPKERSEDQLHTALVSLNQAVEAFGEFPIKMQQSLVRRGWYEHFEAKRVIIRQGHYADNFYFILSGTAVVTILTTNPKTGESFQNTVAFLKKGNSFGELALMYGGTRNATVTCKDDVELLAVGREDFVDIFMHVDKDIEPEHIQFLRTVDLLDGWPTDQLPYEDPKTCLFTYFRRGVIMCRDSNAAEWIYVIKTGTCRVLKALEPARANTSMLAASPDLRTNTGSTLSPRRKRMKNSPVITVPKRGIITQPGRSQLPAINGHTNEAKADVTSREDHKQIINKIFDEKHKDEYSKNGEKKVNFADAKTPPPKPKPNQKIYIQVQKLGPKDTFGMVPIAFNMMHDTMSMILVSDGAECVLISKKFFLQHLNEGHHKRLRQTIQPYPTQESLQQKLQDQLNWEAYKLATVQKEFVYHAKLQESVLD